MMKYNFILGPVDTDSVSICKPDMSPFTEEEQEALINEINSIMPEKIKYAHDGYFKICVAIRAKNYILYDGKKITVKGSSLKASAKCHALKEMINEIIDLLCFEENEQVRNQKLVDLYNKYCKEVKNVTDISRWSARRTISAKTLESTRSNETKIKDAIAGTNYVEGDRIRVFYKPDDSLCLVENFNGEYNKTRLLENIYDTTCVFETVLPVKELFVKYALKKNQKLLEEL